MYNLYQLLSIIFYKLFFFYENNLVLRNRNGVHNLQLDWAVDCKKKPIWIAIWLNFIGLKKNSYTAKQNLLKVSVISNLWLKSYRCILANSETVSKYMNVRIQIVRNFGTNNTCRWHIKYMYCKKKDILVEYHFFFFFSQIIQTLLMRCHG